MFFLDLLIEKHSAAIIATPTISNPTKAAETEADIVMVEPCTDVDVNSSVVELESDSNVVVSKV